MVSASRVAESKPNGYKPAQVNDNGAAPPPPQALEAAEAVLGSILIDPLAFSDVAPIIKAEDYFYLHKHRWIWSAIVRLYERGEPVDTLTLTNELERAGQLAEAGGVPYLTQLLTIVPSSMNADAYARIVEQHAKRRQLMGFANDIARDASRDGVDIDDALRYAQTRLTAIAESNNLTDNAWRIYAEQAKTVADARAYRPKSDGLVGGFLRPRSLNIFFGSPGDGKSNLLFDLFFAIGIGAQSWLPPRPGLPGIGFPVTQCPVLWLDMDNGEEIMSERVAAFSEAYGVPDESQIHWLCFPDPPIVAAKGLPGFTNYALSINAGLIVIDNLLRVAGVKDENSSEMDEAMKNLRKLAEDTGAAVVVIHHRRKDTNGREGDSIRGHSSIEAGIDAAYLVERVKDTDMVTVTNTKSRRRRVEKFAALFTYDLKDDGETLHSARYFGEQVVSKADRELEELKGRILGILADGPRETTFITENAGARAERTTAALKEMWLVDKSITLKEESRKKIYDLRK